MKKKLLNLVTNLLLFVLVYFVLTSVLMTLILRFLFMRETSIAIAYAIGFGLACLIAGAIWEIVLAIGKLMINSIKKR